MEREGRDAAAVRLGPSERTIRRTLTDRHLSRRMTEALLKERDRRHREQPAGVDEDEQGERGEQQQQEQQEERVQTGTGTVEELAARVGVLETELKDWSGCLDHDLELLEQQLRALAGQLGLALSSQMGAKWERRLPPRIHPQLVTVEPAPDDAANYREALPLVAEWRRALADLEDPPHTLAWLRLQERLLVVEIELLDDHRLTLPPAELPWDEVRRHDELRLRRRELADVRRHDELRLRRRELADVRPSACGAGRRAWSGSCGKSCGRVRRRWLAGRTAWTTRLRRCGVAVPGKVHAPACETRVERSGTVAQLRAKRRQIAGDVRGGGGALRPPAEAALEPRQAREPARAAYPPQTPAPQPGRRTRQSGNHEQSEPGGSARDCAVPTVAPR